MAKVVSKRGSGTRRHGALDERVTEHGATTLCSRDILNHQEHHGVGPNCILCDRIAHRRRLTFEDKDQLELELPGGS